MPNYTTELDLLKAVTSGDGNSDTLKVDTSGSSAPVGTATASKQDTGNASLASIDGKITAVNTGAVVVSSSVLPTGAANQTKQDTGNTSLASIDGKVVTVNTAATLLNDVSTNGDLTTSGTYVQIDCTGLGTVLAEIQNFTGVLDVVNFYGSIDGSTFFDVVGIDINLFSGYTGNIPNFVTGSNIGPRQFKFSVTGLKYLRLKAMNLFSTTVHVYLRGSANSNVIEGIHDKVYISGSVDITSSALPSGAATESSLAKLPLAQASTTSGQSGALVQSATTTNAPSYTTAKTNPISSDTSGNIRVSLKDSPANTNKFLVTADAVTFASPQHVIADSGTISTITNVVHVDDNSGSLTVDNGGTFAVQATLAAETTKVIGTVNVAASQIVGLSAGSAVIGHVINDASSAVIGHVIADSGSTTAVTGNVAVTLAAGAAAIAKAEDVSSSDGDVGVPALAVRKASPANTSGSDGDYEFLQMSAGRLWVSANNDQINGVTPLMGNGATGTGSQRVTIASDNTAFSVNATPPTLTKGTQSSTGYSVQRLQDAGRTHINFYASGVASGTTTTETAITMTKSSGTAATSSAASFVITNGKTFRITSITFGTRGNATGTAEITTFSLRVNTGGGVTTSSTPVTLSARSGAAATALAYDRISLTIPDGYEIVGDGTLQFGITANSVFTTNAPTWDVLITGYEY